MKIGFLGTGLMGHPMVLKLLEANLNLTVYNRSPEKLEHLANAGAKIARSAEEVIANTDCTILMLSDAGAIEQLVLSEASLKKLADRTVIQMGTISPTQSKLIGDAIASAGGEYLEAPVLGSIPQVKTGELIVMVGGSQALFDLYQNLLKNFSPNPLYIGEVGSASAMKLALNQLIAGLTSTFALSLSFIKKQGVDVEQFMDIVRESALYAPTFDKKLGRMCDRNFDNPNFPTKHLLKDTNLFLDRAAELDLNTNNLEGIKQIIARAIDLGLAEQDYSAIYNAIDSSAK